MSRKKRRKAIDTARASPAMSITSNTIPAQKARDSFSNPLARLGFGTTNLMEATQYVKSDFTSDYQTMTVLYRENWVVQRLIDVVPHDMTKNWYRLKTKLSPDMLDRFRRLERTTKIRAKIVDGLKWGRLYGGAAAIIVIEGQEDVLETPLELDMIMPGTFRGLIVLDRWSGISASSGLVTDISDPDFGLPEYYTISTEALGTGIRVHHSRILRFIGRPLPILEEVAEQYWGASEIEHIMSELKKYDNTSYNIAMLVFKANLNVYKMEGMEQIATMNQKNLEDFYSTMCAMNWMMNNQGLQIIGQQDSFESHQYTFAGLSDVYEMFMLDLAGAAEMPVTKLFGRSPAGMNATGEADMQNYYDSIEEKQESCRPIFDKLLPIMMMSEFGAVPDDWDYEFESCRRPTEEEKKNIAINTANAVAILYNANIITQRMGLRELKESAPSTGMWGSITEEDLQRADETYGLSGEDVPPELAQSIMGVSSENASTEPHREELYLRP